MTDDNLTERQKRLLMWRDYFKILRAGLMNKDKGGVDSPWTEKDTEVRLWLDVAITEIESDAMHLECGQEEYCRWTEADVPDLAELEGNIDARKL